MTGVDLDFDSDFDDLLKDQKIGGQKGSMTPKADEKSQSMPPTQPTSVDMI